MNNEMYAGVALITGASSGIGAVYADRLAKRGYDLIIVARDATRLQQFSVKLSKETGRTVKPLRADLANKTDLANVERVLREDKTVTMLVNNAGVGAVTPLLETDVRTVDELIDVNVAALTRLTHAAAPVFVARGQGTIINVASTVGLAPERLNGVYAASKAYVLAFTQSLQHELTSKGLRIQAVLPGVTATDIWAKSGVSYQNFSRSIVMSADDLVNAALVGLDRGERVTIPGLQDGDEWERFEAARIAFAQHLSSNEPAPRYRTV